MPTPTAETASLLANASGWEVVSSAFGVIALALFVWMTSIGSALAQEDTTTASESAIESGRKAFNKSDAPPWYDSEGDTIRRVEVEPRNDPPQRPDAADNYPPEPAPPQINGGGGYGAFFADLFWSVIQALGWLAIVAILVIVFMLIAHTVLNRAEEEQVDHAVVDTTSDVDRVEQLPTEGLRRKDDLLGEATRLYEAGEYEEAIIYLYSYQLVQLDKHQQLRLAKGKTNRQYLNELRECPDLRHLIEQSMLAFERVFFGRYPLSRDQFEACWNRLDEFHQQLEPVGV